jgi:hypothetical protein
MSEKEDKPTTTITVCDVNIMKMYDYSIKGRGWMMKT